MAKLNYDETFVNTLHINYDLEFEGKEYRVCVDYADGIQSIEISKEEGDFECLYDDKYSMFSEEDRVYLIELIEEAVHDQDLYENIEIA
jgi:hypothetical protein